MPRLERSPAADHAQPTHTRFFQGGGGGSGIHNSTAELPRSLDSYVENENGLKSVTGLKIKTLTLWLGRADAPS